MSAKHTYEHIGPQPIIHNGTWYHCGDTFQATEDEAKFFLTIGAVKKVSVQPPIVPFTTMKEKS